MGIENGRIKRRIEEKLNDPLAKKEDTDGNILITINYFKEHLNNHCCYAYHFFCVNC